MNTKTVIRLKVVGAVVLFVSSLTVIAIAQSIYNEATANYRTESVCIQGWVDLGIERKYIKSGNGLCSYSRTFGEK
jgi:hypothetical protein